MGKEFANEFVSGFTYQEFPKQVEKQNECQMNNVEISCWSWQAGLQTDQSIAIPR